MVAGKHTDDKSDGMPGPEDVAQFVAQESEIWNPHAADCQGGIAREILEYWHYKRRGRQMPARADLDPLEMRHALGQMIMMDIHRDPLRFRTRLVGSGQARRRGFDFTNKWLDELPPEYRALVLPRAEAVAARGEPVCSRVKRMMDGRWFDYEALWLPLGADGKTPTMIIVCQEFFSN